METIGNSFKWDQNKLQAKLNDGTWHKVRGVLFRVSTKHEYVYQNQRGILEFGESLPVGCEAFMELNVNDVLESVELTDMPKENWFLPHFLFRDYQRELVAKHFRSIHRDRIFPSEILGRIEDLEIEKVQITPLYKGVLTGNCYKCDGKADGICDSCHREVCKFHGILGRVSSTTSVHHVYCEDCLYLLNNYNTIGNGICTIYPNGESDSVIPGDLHQNTELHRDQEEATGSELTDIYINIRSDLRRIATIGSESREYLIKRIDFTIVTKYSYYCKRPDSGFFVGRLPLESYSKIRELEKDDVYATLEIEELQGSRFYPIYFIYGRNEREELAEFFKRIMDLADFSILKIYGVLKDIKNLRLEKDASSLIEIARQSLGDNSTMKCYACDRGPVAQCRLCHRPTCEDHCIVAGTNAAFIMTALSGFSPYFFQVCEDCMFLMNADYKIVDRTKIINETERQGGEIIDRRVVFEF